ncbi:MAG: flagellar basal body L-ring protein FlgH [Gallionella sp.]
MRRQFMAGMLLVLAGCSMTPPTRVQQPMTALPVDRQVVLPADGAIFHPGTDQHALFEDKRAREVGDTLTIVIQENTTGARQSSGGSSTSNDVNANLPSLFNALPVTSSSSSKTATTGTGAASVDLTGTISVTVIKVMSNGNLLVSGEKQVSLNNSDEYIRFSGVVNPVSITNLNSVSSTQVADAHLEYKNAGAMSQFINDTKSLGFLGRFFQSVLPF